MVARLLVELLRAPTRVERVEKAGFVGDKGLAGMREQDVITAQFAAARGGLQQEGVARGIVAMQCPQVVRTRDLADALSQLLERSSFRWCRQNRRSSTRRS